MKSILIVIVFLLSGCATQSNEELLRGEIYHSKQRLNDKNEFEQKITLKDKEFYQFTYYF